MRRQSDREDKNSLLWLLSAFPVQMNHFNMRDVGQCGHPVMLPVVFSEAVSLNLVDWAPLAHQKSACEDGRHGMSFYNFLLSGTIQGV